MRWLIVAVAVVLAAVAAYVFVAPRLGGPEGVSVEKPGEVTAPAVTPVPDAAPPAGMAAQPAPAPAAAPDPAAPGTAAPNAATPGTAAQTEAAAEGAVAAAAAQAEAEAQARAKAEAETARIRAVLADPAARDKALSVEGYDPAVAEAAIDAASMAGPQKLALKNLLKASSGDPALLAPALGQVRAAVAE